MSADTAHAMRHSSEHHDSGFDRRTTMSDVRDRAATVGHDVKDLAATAGAAACDQLGPIEEYVRGKPLKSLLIAAGAGALFGLLFLRR